MQHPSGRHQGVTGFPPLVGLRIYKNGNADKDVTI